MPPAAALRDFNQSFAALTPGLEPYFCDGEIAVAFHPVPGRPIKDRIRDPEFFACLRAARRLEDGISVADRVEVDRPFDKPETLSQRAASLLRLVGDGAAFRLSVLDFFALFWEAGRAAWMHSQAQAATVPVPVTSAQVVDVLSELTPPAAEVLKRIHRAYVLELHGGPSDAIRYMNWAGRYASQLAQMLLSPGRPRVELPAATRTELTMSVLIITRNRAAQLDEALASLVQQERRPDQVVVVNNASSDHTPAVVKSYEDRLNLTLVRDETVGIPHARNTGLSHCTGDIVASMDDDCRAHRRWLAEIEVPFLKDPRIGAVGGSLVPAQAGRSLVERFYSARMEPAARTRRTDHR